MSFSTCTRGRIQNLCQVSRRCMSSGASSNLSATPSSSKVKSHLTLPPAKMRALVALYHQTDKWITPENLEQRIDEAFVPSDNVDKIDLARLGGGSRSTSSVTFEALERTARGIETAPKMAQWNAAAPMLTKSARINQGSWNNNRAKREHKVIEALYGVVTTPDAQLKPGYDVVAESAKYLKEED
ncbi:hypothetical protein D9619_000968 [Psilocybe cf. subviscida]|uniref:Uncharacterized protein n=1 Tax=Psilocybe cf. subviscida TaxID=2480587 RepID=A0A8H5BI35_9AGAR|nr:hypothetical protein D9619_000968 [Psilocybe cf. subviscida]